MGKRKSRKMEVRRRALQGVTNILLFNWHFYLMAIMVVVMLLVSTHFVSESLVPFVMLLLILVVGPIAVSLIVSYWIYDHSDLYALPWLPDLEGQQVLSVNAGFDEISSILEKKYPTSSVSICDFYDQDRHTEVSVKRARRAYPLHPATIQISTDQLPFADQTFDYIIAMLSVHEIRDQKERGVFFKELRRVLKPHGSVFVTEHLRDFNNFIAFTLGFLHFHSKSTWLRTFEIGMFQVVSCHKTTPFVTTFTIRKDGTAH